MFTIIISEKGGAERRESFDRNEINVGRVQGNDLMLPKGNVSKHHARLLYRDGRFIVTDLKSTNGTYVNGRKISQATIVREGDKIYIGDFVVRLETGPSSANLEGDDAHPRAPRISAVHRDAAVSSGPSLDFPTGAPPPPGPIVGAVSAPPVSPPQRSVESAVSHFPLERDPDSESAPDLGLPPPRVPGPPRLPADHDGRPRATTAMLGIPVLAPIARAPSRPTAQQQARRQALIALIDRVADAIDLSVLDAAPVVEEGFARRLEAVVNEQAKAMHEEGEAPETIDLELLVRDGLRELTGLGPIGPLLEGDQAEEIVVPRSDVVLAARAGQATLVDPAFTSEEALARTVARLAHLAGEPILPGEAIIDRRLKRGARMIAIAPPVASAWTLTIRKQVRASGSLEDQVRIGALSRPMATLLEACVGARANILVVGTGAGLVAGMVAAMAFASGAGERIAVLADSDDIHVGHAHVTRLALTDRGARGEEALWAATRLRPDRLVIASLVGAVAAATIDAISDGGEGVIAALAAPSLRQALARLAAQVALARPGASIESARDAVAECFDIVVEVARAHDGRPKITRLGELAGTDATGIVIRDLFLPNPEGTGDAGFSPTGAMPRCAAAFASRGIRLDPALFKRR